MGEDGRRTGKGKGKGACLSNSSFGSGLAEGGPLRPRPTGRPTAYHRGGGGGGGGDWPVRSLVLRNNYALRRSSDRPTVGPRLTVFVRPSPPIAMPCPCSENYFAVVVVVIRQERSPSISIYSVSMLVDLIGMTWGIWEKCLVLSASDISF